MKDGSKFARRGVMNLAPYIPGKPTEEVEREYGVHNVVKLASNENPLKTSPMAVEAMRKEAVNSYLYPEGSSPMVREAIAEHTGVKPENVIVGNGGDHVIGLLCHAFITEGEEVIIGTPSFRTYGLNAAIMGAKIVEVPLKDMTFDLDAILAAITPKTKLIFFCNPNNPTGTIVGKKKVAEFMSKVPEHVIVVFDEAYTEYVADPEYPNGVDYVKQDRNVMVVRTFSKIYGLAGNRVGYAIAPAWLIDVVGRVIPAFPVNRMAQVGAVAALHDTEFLSEVRKVNLEGIAYLCKEFDKLDMPYAKPNGNFIFVDMRMPAKEIFVELMKRAFVIRPGNQWGYDTYARITVGTMEQNKALIAALTELKAIYSKK